jgi:glucan-binding YG repeat protein
VFRFFIIVVLTVGGYFGLANMTHVSAIETEIPRLQFPVISDTHICGEPQTLGGVPICQDYSRDLNLGRALEDYQETAPNYKAIAVVGDLTNQGMDQQYLKFAQTLNQYVPSYIEKVFAIGNHEFFEKKYDRTLTDEDMINRFLALTGKERLYYDTWIYGYHFIVLGSESTETGDYNSAFISEEQYQWLEERIAVNTSENKPIFVFLHQSIKDTIYGSEYWSGISDSRLADILRKYPQSILFTGHSHYLLEHPRTVYQDGFTMVNTGAVAYGYYDGGNLFDKSQGLLVNVFKDRVEIKARDFGTQTWINQYSIEVPYKKTYDDIELPAFSEEAGITIDSVDHKSARVSWDPATDNGIIEKYEIYLNGKLWDTKYPRYWEEGVSIETVMLRGLLQHTDYNIEVIGIDGYGNRTQIGLKTSFQTTWTYSGWVNEDGNWYFYDPETGTTRTGWVDYEGKRFYMNDTGIMQTGWISVDGKWYYLDEKGVMQVGWKLYKDKWYYLDETGAMQTGWELVNGKWYYLAENGTMVSGWLLENGKWYYLAADGSMKTGWLKSGTKWYYLSSKGMVTKWSQIGGKWYFFDQNGAMKTGWIKDGEKWYYLESSGSMKTGWLKYSDAWYYLDIKSGAMVNGWKYIGGKWYYFYGNGKMAVNTTVNGYKIGANGAMY